MADIHKRCGGRWYYEGIAGMRLYRVRGRTRFYRWWCERCGQRGEKREVDRG